MPTAPVIRIDVPGSFPWGVFHERHPELVRQVLAARPYGPAERAAVGELLAESTGGLLEPPGAGLHDRAEWLVWGEGLWGRPWSEAPFLWAESWFHRRLLDATGYFRPGPWQGVDPYAPFKDAELAGEAVDGELAALDGLADLPGEARARAVLSSALWGNRADLSFRMAAGPEGAAASDLVADDSGLLLAELERVRGGTVCIVADNAARELLPDLVLADHLLAADEATRVLLHVKPQPYFVSDATPADVLAAVDRLRAADGAAARAVGERLRRAVDDGVLRVAAHPFSCAPLPYRDMPADLRAELAGVDLTVLKGDLNYRRLVGDRHWPPTTPFADVAGHFPSPVAVLRTLKSDVVTGLSQSTVTRLDTTGPDWRTAGTHALVQVRTRA
ncbi:damage-control phosphatase ARMT1 family protein [Streptomyces sp. NRRL B-24484]|uniref:damage-control phosphatase ARMT1 family protein n=1 Tax=Streptomyces sp. NRRL B-24484 TaxID=1463833 RepID=UPI0004C205D1|nr:damage-control phosphatase ARMT1 family protein [Streptomyces sp. NRRL B-24484]